MNNFLVESYVLLSLSDRPKCFSRRNLSVKNLYRK